MKKMLMATMASAAVLGLAACGSEDVENTPVDDIDEIVDEDEPYPVGGDLNEDQQANYDAMDRQAVSDEYDANMADMQSEMNSGGGMADGSMESGSMEDGAMSGSGSMESDSMAEGDAMSGGASMGDGSAMSASSGSSMPARSAMDFSYLDRNDDGQLSVAEYAIWALPTDPVPPEPNDARGPHLTQDEINEAGQTFFYFDDDGDSYLSQEEFQDARNSGRVA
ncbi:EF-hand domain-containing protein [Aurantiacibacter odishensis]|uniref:EF-hand domain-containing protein n=1 Tax=Aurantiacibacter odishensis TaxID=1155476 RepID=UPI000E71BDFA|nr:EF-hand domain-containing protein [Aurantiacibacter odishensis]